VIRTKFHISQWRDNSGVRRATSKVGRNLLAGAATVYDKGKCKQVHTKRLKQIGGLSRKRNQNILESKEIGKVSKILKI
jgi:hypothetical protein